MAQHVVTPVYEGPFDVLLHLINTHEIDVLEVPLAPVVEGFVAELAARRAALGLDVVSEFLLVAAILLEIKSKTLLPGSDEVDEDEELEGLEARDVLLSRLLECQAYAAAGQVFAAWAEQEQRSIPREVGLDEHFVPRAPDLLKGVTPSQLVAAYRRATAVKPEPHVDLSHVTVDMVTVSEAVEELAGVLPARRVVSFRDLTRGLQHRIEIIVRFLALLELCKLGKVSLGQGGTFGELQVQWIAGAGAMAGVPTGRADSDTDWESATDDYEG